MTPGVLRQFSSLRDRHFETSTPRTFSPRRAKPYETSPRPHARSGASPTDGNRSACSANGIGRRTSSGPGGVRSGYRSSQSRLSRSVTLATYKRPAQRGTSTTRTSICSAYGRAELRNGGDGGADDTDDGDEGRPDSGLGGGIWRSAAPLRLPPAAAPDDSAGSSRYRIVVDKQFSRFEIRTHRDHTRVPRARVRCTQPQTPQPPSSAAVDAAALASKRKSGASGRHPGTTTADSAAADSAALAIGRGTPIVIFRGRTSACPGRRSCGSRMSPAMPRSPRIRSMT